MRRAGLVRHHARQDRHAHVLGRAAADQHHRAVVEDVVAGAGFGHAREILHRRHRRCRADTDAAHGHTVVAQQVGEPHHDLPLLLGDLSRLGLVAGVIRVPGVAQNPVEGQAALRAQLARHFEGILRRRVHARAVVAAVHLEPDVQSGPREGLGSGEVVHQHPQRGALRDPPDVGDVRRIERKCPGEVRETGAGERLRFEQRGDRQTTGAVRDLPFGQVDTLVRFDVWPQRNAETRSSLCHVREIPLHHVQVQKQRRGLGRDPVDHEGLRTRTRALLPIGTRRNRAYFRGLMA